MIGYVEVDDTLVELSTIAADVSIRVGRQDVYTAYAPSSCRIVFYDATVNLSSYVVGQSLEVFDTSMGARFTGDITDATLTVASPTSGATLVVTAVGRSARLAYRTQTSLRPEENVVDRTSALLTDGGLGGAASVLQWATADLSTRVAAQTANPGAILRGLDEVTSSARSVIFDRGDGAVVWQSIRYRPSISTVGSMSIGSVLFAPTFQQSNQIINRVRVSYATGEVQLDDTTSQSRFGIREAAYSTQLVSMGDAADLATDYMKRSKRPRWAMPTVTFVQAATETRYEIGQVVSIPSLPTGSPTSTYYGVVEGWEDSYQRGDHRTTYFLSDPAVSGVALQWDDIPSTSPYRWDTIDTNVIWDDALTLADLGA